MKWNSHSRGKITITVLILTLTSCATPNMKAEIMEKETKPTNAKSGHRDSIPKVTGIGGVFFYSDNPQETNEWYSKNLGFEINEWGSSSFESRNANNPDKINSLQWKLFENGDDYFSPSKKKFMINYQVQNIEGLVAKLKENGVTILDSIATYDYGKFVHIMDNEGNKIELWESVDLQINNKTKTNTTMDSRDILIGQINDGLDTTQVGDNSNKSILVRGCDPEMARRAMKLLPPVLGNPEMVSVTNDDDFITQLERKKWSVIFFAPGACRYDAAQAPIPGSRAQTKGWGLA